MPRQAGAADCRLACRIPFPGLSPERPTEGGDDGSRGDGSAILQPAERLGRRRSCGRRTPTGPAGPC